MTNYTSPWFSEVPDELRYPKLNKNIETEVAIVGGGIVGVLTAYHLAKEGKQVTLIDQNHIAGGDTGMTTAFLSRLPDANLHKIARKYGQAYLAKTFTATENAQRELFEFIIQELIDCDLQECSTYIGSFKNTDSKLKSDLKVLHKAGIKAELVKKSAEHPFIQAIKFDPEGHFHIRKFIFSLLNTAFGKKVAVFENTKAEKFEFTENKIQIVTEGGLITADKVILATGLPHPQFKELLSNFRTDVTYAVTAKITGEMPIKNNLYWDTDKPYHYFRQLDKQTMIVGGSDHMDILPPGKAFTKLKDFLSKKLKARDFTVENKWYGMVFRTPDGLPIIDQHPKHPNLFYISGLWGNGMVMGAMSAKIAADWAIEKSNPAAGLFKMRSFRFSLIKYMMWAINFIAVLMKQKEPTAKKPIFRNVATVADIQPGYPLCVSANGQKIALFQINDEYFAVDNQCSHINGPLCKGKLKERIIQCPWHGSRFDITTGAVVGGPATQNIKSYKVKVVKGNVQIEI